MRRAWTQHAWEARCTNNLPAGVVRELKAGHAARIGAKDPASSSPVYVANIWIGQRYKELRASKVQFAYDEEAIRVYARNYAHLCSSMRSLEGQEAFAADSGIQLDEKYSPDGKKARLSDAAWWRRQLRKIWTRRAEDGMRELGIIRRGKEPYASDSACEHRKIRLQRMRDWIDACVAVNEMQDIIELRHAVDASIANQEIRRGELMTRSRGFEEIAQDYKHVWTMGTLTAPSAFHAQLSDEDQANPRFEHKRVKEAQQWLCTMWARVRAEVKRQKILIYGLRTVEPHHDGTPHWHMLIHAKASHLQSFKEIVERFWLSQYADEPGAQKHRVKWSDGNAERGTSAGYIAKYVAKNIDGAGSIGSSEDLETGTPVHANTLRIQAWAATHGIRQFQQIGGPPVGLWRECRRIREEVEDIDIERARRAADDGDWRRFVQRVGGIHAGRKTNITLRKEETGEVNRYGELRPARIVGVQCASSVMLTRLHRWRLMLREKALLQSQVCSSLGPVAITVAGAAGANEPAGWTNPQESSQAPPEKPH